MEPPSRPKVTSFAGGGGDNRQCATGPMRRPKRRRQAKQGPEHDECLLWSIKNPIPSVMIFFLLTLAGLFSFSAMKVQNFPILDLPTVTVSASVAGGFAGQLENEVARKIENSIATCRA